MQARSKLQVLQTSTQVHCFLVISPSWTEMITTTSSLPCHQRSILLQSFSSFCINQKLLLAFYIGLSLTSFRLVSVFSQDAGSEYHPCLPCISHPVLRRHWRVSLRTWLLCWMSQQYTTWQCRIYYSTHQFFFYIKHFTSRPQHCLLSLCQSFVQTAHIFFHKLF